MNKIELCVVGIEVFQMQPYSELEPILQGYESVDPVLPGPRHRSLFSKQGTQYIHSGADVSEPAMDQP